MEFTVAITGASGAIYGHRTLVHMAASAVVNRINLVLSASAETVARVELGVDLRGADTTSINEWLGLPRTSQLMPALMSFRQVPASITVRKQLKLWLITLSSVSLIISVFRTRARPDGKECSSSNHT